MKQKIRKSALCIGATLTVLLPACGGGGGSDDSSPPPPVQKYTLSGTVRPATGTAIDSDVNDPDAPFQANNSVADAQPLPNPITLGGYVNQAGSGPNGRSSTAGDLVDVYRVSLLQGQQVSLLIAGDGSRNDLDLGLYDLAGKLLDGSVSQSRTESLTIKNNGDYLLVVKASRGASNYILTVGQTSTVSREGIRLSDEFIPGEVVVKFQEGAIRASQALGLTVSERGEDQERNQLVRVEDWRAVQAAEAADCGLPIVLPGGLATADDALQAKQETLCTVKQLALDPAVATVTPNYLRQSQFTPNDPLYAFQWHYPQISLPQAWELTTGNDVIVAVVDSGIVPSHPDLQGQLVAGYDFVKNPDNALDGDGIDADPTDVGDKSNPDGTSSFHGTHVAGTVAAATNNKLGVAGIAFGAKIMPMRAVGRLGGSLYDIEQAVRYAAGLANDSGKRPARRADVINLSLGSTASSPTEQALMDEVRAAGVIVVAAAGNKGNTVPYYPAAYPGVLAVSAVTLSKTLAPYSNYGSWISLAAPGGSVAQDLNGDGKPDGVLSTVATDAGGTLATDYVIWQGTSMAAPHVAGVMALMKALAPTLSAQEVSSLLIRGALTEDLGAAGRDDQFGYGMINAYKAAVAAASTSGQPVNPVPLLGVSPAALNFGPMLTRQTLIVLNAGAGKLTVKAPTEDSGGWLRITPTQTHADGTGTYAISVDRTGLADGVYSATLTFNSSANSVRVKVIMQVANTLGAGTVGQQYVLLIDPQTNKAVVNGVVTRQADGSFSYTLSQVPAGTYEIYSGSDSNNNSLICDAGESCGAYLTTNQPIRVQVSGNQSGLDFVSGYAVSLANSQAMGAAEPATGLQRQTTGQAGIAR